MKLKLIVATVATLAAGMASAAGVATDAAAAIATAQTDALTVAGALTGLSIAVWGANYIRRKFFGR